MIGTDISHYKILEKLGEVPNFPTSDPQRVALRHAQRREQSRAVGSLSIPPFFGGSRLMRLI
jgi:hypothetical protein